MLSEEEIAAVSKHKFSHDLEFCSCPCFAALMKVASKMPDVKVAARIEGMLAILSVPEEADHEHAV